jgi:signal transduction histidine kinase
MSWALLFAVSLLVALLAAQARSHRRLRSELLDAAHELARPLTALRVALTAGELRVPPEILDTELVRAGTIVDQLRRLGGTGCRSDGELFDLSGLVREVSTVWNPVAATAGATITVEAASPVPVVADRARMGQAITNIVANAIEHGEGAVRLALTRIDGACRLEVTNAVGPKPESARGYSVARSIRGRGLRIVEAAVSASGGRLEAARAAEGRVAIELPTALRVR